MNGSQGSYRPVTSRAGCRHSTTRVSRGVVKRQMHRAPRARVGIPLWVHLERFGLQRVDRLCDGGEAVQEVLLPQCGARGRQARVALPIVRFGQPRQMRAAPPPPPHVDPVRGGGVVRDGHRPAVTGSTAAAAGRQLPCPPAPPRWIAPTGWCSGSASSPCSGPRRPAVRPPATAHTRTHEPHAERPVGTRVSDHQWDSGALDDSPPGCRSAPTATALCAVVVGQLLGGIRTRSQAGRHRAGGMITPPPACRSPRTRGSHSMPTDDQVVSCPFDHSDALVALAARGPGSRIRLPCGEAGAWLMTSHARVRQVTRDPRLSRAAIVGRDHPRMAPEPIVSPEAINVADTPVGAAAPSDDLRTARRIGGGPRGPAGVHDAAAATAPGSGICVWLSVRKRCAGAPRPSAAFPLRLPVTW